MDFTMCGFGQATSIAPRYRNNLLSALFTSHRKVCSRQSSYRSYAESENADGIEPIRPAEWCGRIAGSPKRPGGTLCGPGKFRKRECLATFELISFDLQKKVERADNAGSCI